MEEFQVYPLDRLPIGMEDHLKVIPVDEIQGVWITRGGRLTVSQTAGIVIGIAGGTGLGLLIGGPVGALIGGNLMGVGGGQEKLRAWSVFEDSLVLSDDHEKKHEKGN